LGEESERDEDDETMTIARSLEKLDPSIAFELFLQCKRLTDLTVFDLDELVIDVSACVTFA
jgi:hypothetical protein